MNYKLINRDLKRGILRKRNLLIPIFFLITQAACCSDAALLHTVPTWMDYLLSAFAGRLPVEVNIHQPVSALPPLEWLAGVGGILFLSLDYPLGDLSGEGMQVLIRTGSKRKWFLSKCIWNIANCLLYATMLLLSGLIWTFLSKGDFSLVKYTDAINMVYEWTINTENIAPELLFLTGFLMPFLVMISLNLLQMSLCMFTKPIFALMLALAVLIISVYNDSPYLIGNIAMGIRTLAYIEKGCSVVQLLLVPLVIICLSIIIGSVRFGKMDILLRED